MQYKKDFLIKNIVSNTENYEHLLNVKLPTVMIYGELDKIIAPFNIPKVLKVNSHIEAIKTVGTHGMKNDKYAPVAKALKRFLSKKEENEII